MPIQGLTTNTQFGSGLPRIAKLYKGDEKPESGNRPGADLNYFRVEFEPQYEYIRPVWLRLYGEQPVEFAPVFLAATTVDEAFSNWKEEWNAAQTLLHRCDGETQVIHFDSTTQDYIKTPTACAAPSCGCKAIGRLSLILPELVQETGLLGTVSVSTHSLNDILTVYRYLADIQRLRGGDLNGIPFIFGRAAREISAPKQVKTKGGYQRQGRIKVNKSLFYIYTAPNYTQERLLPMLATVMPAALPQISASEGRALLGGGSKRRLGEKSEREATWIDSPEAVTKFLAWAEQRFNFFEQDVLDAFDNASDPDVEITQITDWRGDETRSLAAVIAAAARYDEKEIGRLTSVGYKVEVFDAAVAIARRYAEMVEAAQTAAPPEEV